MAYDVPPPPTFGLPEARAVGGQPAMRAEDIERFVSDRWVATLAYVRRDGLPHQTPIWYTYRDGTFLMTTATGSAKERSLQRNPQASLTISDHRPPYRALVVEGRATLSPLDTSSDPTDGMATRYLGRLAAAEYEKLSAATFAETGLTLITLVPTALRGFDNTHAIGRTTLAFVRLREHLPLPRRWI